MADDPLIEAALEELGRLPFPGYDADIVSLGVVAEVARGAAGGVVVTLRQASARPEVMRELDGAVEGALRRRLGGAAVELKVQSLAPELGEKTGRARLEGTRHVVAVASGKGGVGKSTVAANLALALSALGARTGLLDADIYGPSVPMLFGVGDAKPSQAGGQNFFPVERYGVKLISIGFFLTERSPVIWRGPLVAGAVQQFLKDTLWGTQDFLLVDLPPGTGDAQLTLAQQVALDGVVIVTTPQEVALLDARRALAMFRQVHCPLLGVIENMSDFVCPQCGESEALFGSSGGERLAQSEGTRLLGRVPLYPELCEAGDAGMPITLADPDHPASKAFVAIARTLMETIPD